MAWFHKKPDPITERARALNSQIAALEAEIRSLDHRLQQPSSQPRFRSTALPQSRTVDHSPAPGTSLAADTPAEPLPELDHPIFEEIGQDRLQARTEGTNDSGHFNELGVRKYDLPALVRRLRGHFRGPSTTNPKLVSYLAAGGIQGLRPLRYEKRVARNRFILLVLFLFLALLGLLAVFGRK